MLDGNFCLFGTIFAWFSKKKKGSAVYLPFEMIVLAFP